MTRPRTSLAVFVTAALLGGCGGGDDGGGSTAPIGDSQRIAAATTTAQNHTLCNAIRPFYWEIGNAGGARASASLDVAGHSGPPVYTATTEMPIASASKWLYGAYVAQVRGAAGLSADDIKFLNFRSGYSDFSFCQQDDTVNGCLSRGDNGVHKPATDGKFAYGGGHMENHAARFMNLGPADNGALAAAVRGQIGTDIAMVYTQPQPAGGVASSASAYGIFLRKLLNGQLRMGGLLGSHPVCTNPDTCPPGTAVRAPVPQTESWHYSIGHWVEDDPVLGDGALSSAGALGFYPWVSADKSWYGIVARKDGLGSGEDSVACGRLVRKAWVTGTVVQ